MEFSWTADDLAYRATIRSFLAERLPPGWSGYDKSDLQGYRAESQAFATAMAARGWLTQSWPAEYGGQDASPWRAAILSEECWPIGEPRGPQYMNVSWIGPAIIHAGSAEQKRYHLARIAAGNVFWCQGFSEPNAGSDLRSLRTRAVREGDEYIVNGSKIWTSHAGIADFCFLLVRTGSDEAHGSGISILLVPMKTPGLQVRPILNLVNVQSFHEVTFTDMRVPVSCRLGDENAGWEIVKHALAFERVGVAHYQMAHTILERAVAEARRNGLINDPEIQSHIGQVYASIQAARMLVYKVIDMREKKFPPTVDSNIARVAAVNCLSIAAEFEQSVFGEEALDSKAEDDLRHSLVLGIAAGTLEVQLNLIASLYLQLPRGK